MGAQVAGCAKRSVVNVEGIRCPVTIAVAPRKLPRGGDELHGPHGTVPACVTIEGSGIRVSNGGEPVSVQARANNGSAGLSRGVQASAAVGPVVGFDEANCRHRIPADPAARRGLVGRARRSHIGPQHPLGNAGLRGSLREPAGIRVPGDVHGGRDAGRKRFEFHPRPWRRIEGHTGIPAGLLEYPK